MLIEHTEAPTQPEAVSRFIDQFGDGGRVVGMQRILQAVSDPFLGTFVGRTTYGAQRDFYVRQFRDKKGGFDMDALDDKAFLWYAQACAATPRPSAWPVTGLAAVAGYIGGGRVAGRSHPRMGLSPTPISRSRTGSCSGGIANVEAAA